MVRWVLKRVRVYHEAMCARVPVVTEIARKALIEQLLAPLPLARYGRTTLGTMLLSRH